jgi:hypothetical protein
MRDLYGALFEDQSTTLIQTKSGHTRSTRIRLQFISSSLDLGSAYREARGLQQPANPKLFCVCEVYRLRAGSQEGTHLHASPRVVVGG